MLMATLSPSMVHDPSPGSTPPILFDPGLVPVFEPAPAPLPKVTVTPLPLPTPVPKLVPITPWEDPLPQPLPKLPAPTQYSSSGSSCGSSCGGCGSSCGGGAATTAMPKVEVATPLVKENLFTTPFPNIPIPTSFSPTSDSASHFIPVGASLKDPSNLGLWLFAGLCSATALTISIYAARR